MLPPRKSYEKCLMEKKKLKVERVKADTWGVI
jgi:hypothetical protein